MEGSVHLRGWQVAPGTWHLDLTFEGTGTRWRLLEVERHTSFSRSALSSRACTDFSYGEGHFNQTVLRLELRNQESPSQLTRSPSGKAVQPVTWWRVGFISTNSTVMRNLDQLLIRQGLPPHLKVGDFSVNRKRGAAPVSAPRRHNVYLF